MEFLQQFKQVKLNNQILEDDRDFLEEALRNTKRENLHIRETLKQLNNKMRNLLIIIRQLQDQLKSKGTIEISSEVLQNMNIKDILSDVEDVKEMKKTQNNIKSHYKSKILKSMDNRFYEQMISPYVKERFDSTIENNGLQQVGSDIFLLNSNRDQRQQLKYKKLCIELVKQNKELKQYKSVTNQIQEFINSQTQRQNELIHSQNRQLQQQRQQIVQLKNELARSSQTNEYENIFRSCVNQVISDDNSKNYDKSQSRTRLKSAIQTERQIRDLNKITNMISSNQNLKDDNITLSSAKRDELKTHQKRQVQYLFIKNEYIYNNIYNQMFPQRYQQTPRNQNQNKSGGKLSFDNMKFQVKQFKFRPANLQYYLQP